MYMIYNNQRCWWATNKIKSFENSKTNKIKKFEKVVDKTKNIRYNFKSQLERVEKTEMFFEN